MKKTLFKLSILFALYMVTTNVYAQDLYLIIGQSNAAGRDTNIDVNGEDALTNDVKYLADDRGFLKGRQPLNKYSGLRKDLDIQGVNFGLEFGKEMHEHTGNKVYLVVNARGGTKVAQWRKTNSSYDYYANTKLRVEQAEAECNCSLKGILWHQGEGNVNSTDGSFTSSYFSTLNELIKELRADFGHVPFIVGQLNQVDKNKNFNNAVKLVDDSNYEISDVEWATAKNLTTFDGTHFDAASTRLLGRRYAKRMKQFIAEERAIKESIIAEKVAGRKVNLTWITNESNEVNAPIKYTIQHSTNELNYTDLFTMSPRDENDIEAYTDQHDTPSIGDNFYRLKIDYLDEASKYYYENENIFFNPTINPAFPNPTKDVLHVDLSEFMGKSAVMTLCNIQGTVLKSVAVGNNHEKVVSINLSDFKNGLYSLQIKTDDIRAISQMVIISNTY